MRADAYSGLSPFRLATRDSKAAEPATLSAAVPDMRVGDNVPLGDRSLRVVGKRDEDAAAPPVLVVEDVAEEGDSAAA
jgi:hypothetical protein